MKIIETEKMLEKINEVQMNSITSECISRCFQLAEFVRTNERDVPEYFRFDLPESEEDIPF